MAAYLIGQILHTHSDMQTIVFLFGGLICFLGPALAVLYQKRQDDEPVEPVERRPKNPWTANLLSGQASQCRGHADPSRVSDRFQNVLIESDWDQCSRS